MRTWHGQLPAVLAVIGVFFGSAALAQTGPETPVQDAQAAGGAEDRQSG